MNVADDDVEARLRRRGAAHGGEAGVEHELRHLLATSMCSSSGIIWIGSMPGALFHEKCGCASNMPGISVAPMPSMTVAPPCVALELPPSRDEPRVTCLMRLPWISTSPV